MQNVFTSRKYIVNFLLWWLNAAPVVVHVANEHGVEGVEVSAEHGELIQNEQLSFLVVAFTVSLEQLLLSHNLQFISRAVVEVAIHSEQLVSRKQ